VAGFKAPKPEALPKLGKIPAGLARSGRAAIPKSAGSKDTRYVAGFNPRKGHYTASVGTNPSVQAPPPPSTLGSDSAPFKHEAPTGGKFDISGITKP